MPKMLLVNGSYTSSPKEMSQILNNFFIDKVKNICSLLTNNLVDPLSYLRLTISGWTQYNSVPIFEFQPVTPADVRKVIKSLKLFLDFTSS